MNVNIGIDTACKFILLIYFFVLSGFLIIKSAQKFIDEHGGGSVSPVSYITCLVVFTVFCSFAVIVDFYYQYGLKSVIRVFIILGFFIQFYILDVTKRWLPFCFTVSFIVSGLIFKLSIFNTQDGFYYLTVLKSLSSMIFLYLDNPVAAKLIIYSMKLPDELPVFTAFIYGMVTGTSVFFVFLLFRYFAIRKCRREVFGLGDVYLITGISVWLSAPAMIYILFFSAVLAGGVSSIKYYLYKYNQYEPFAPYLCGFSALYVMIPTLSKVISIVGFL